MIDGIVVGKAAAETLTLLNTILKMIETAEAEGKSVSMAEVLADLPPQALKLAHRFMDDLGQLQTDFYEAFKSNPLELDKTLPELQSQTWWWRWKRYKLLRNFAPTVDAIKRQLDALLSDFIAVAHCKEADSLLAESYKKVEAIRQAIDANTDFTRLSVRQVLKNLINDAKTVHSQLEDMVHGRKK